jgi:hypothetical protein
MLDAHMEKRFVT